MEFGLDTSLQGRGRVLQHYRADNCTVLFYSLKHRETRLVSIVFGACYILLPFYVELVKGLI